MNLFVDVNKMVEKEKMSDKVLIIWEIINFILWLMISGYMICHYSGILLLIPAISLALYIGLGITNVINAEVKDE